MQSSLVFMYRMTNNHLEIPSLYHPASSKASTRARHSHKFWQPQTNVECYRNSFLPRTIPVWNQLSSDAVDAESLEDFKLGVADYRRH